MVKTGFTTFAGAGAEFVARFFVCALATILLWLLIGNFMKSCCTLYLSVSGGRTNVVAIPCRHPHRVGGNRVA